MSGTNSTTLRLGRLDNEGNFGGGSFSVANTQLAGTITTVSCGNCGTTNSAKLAVCTRCREVLPAAQSEHDNWEATRAAFFTADHHGCERENKRRPCAHPGHYGDIRAARDVLLALGLIPDRKAKPPRAPAGCVRERKTGYQRPGVV